MSRENLSDRAAIRLYQPTRLMIDDPPLGCWYSVYGLSGKDFAAFGADFRALKALALASTVSAAQRVAFRFGWRLPIVQVLVRDGNVDQALRALKKKMQREGIFREMKLRRNYEKPSERKAREKAEAVRRARKLLRKRLEREGY